MRLSTPSRIVLIIALLGFVWMLNAGVADATQAPTLTQRVASIVVSAIALLFAAGLAFPRRGRLATRIVAGCVLLAYVLYFVTELVAWFRGKEQTMEPGNTSVLLAAIGLVIWGIPMLVYALGGPSPLDILSGRWTNTRNGKRE